MTALSDPIGKQDLFGCAVPLYGLDIILKAKSDNSQTDTEDLHTNTCAFSPLSECGVLHTLGFESYLRTP